MPNRWTTSVAASSPSVTRSFRSSRSGIRSTNRCTIALRVRSSSVTDSPLQRILSSSPLEDCGKAGAAALSFIGLYFSASAQEVGDDAHTLNRLPGFGLDFHVHGAGLVVRSRNQDALSREHGHLGSGLVEKPCPDLHLVHLSVVVGSDESPSGFERVRVRGPLVFELHGRELGLERIRFVGETVQGDVLSPLWNGNHGLGPIHEGNGKDRRRDEENDEKDRVPPEHRNLLRGSPALTRIK